MTGEWGRMSWYSTLKSAMPVLDENPSYVENYMDIGHPDWGEVADQYKNRGTRDVQLWGVTPDFTIHVTPDNDNIEDYNHDLWETQLSQKLDDFREFLFYGRYERNNEHPDGICSVLAMYKIESRIPSPIQRSAALARVEKLLDKQFGSPAIVIMTPGLA